MSEEIEKTEGNEVKVDTIRIEAFQDKYDLAASITRPTTSSVPKAVVVIGPATGVKRGYYIPFASFLAEHGIPALVFDWRGIGDSVGRGGVCASKATWDDWADRDMRGALAFMHAQYPTAELVLVGHSVGSHVLAHATSEPGDPYSRIARVLSLNAQNAYWNASPFPTNVCQTCCRYRPLFDTVTV